MIDELLDTWRSIDTVARSLSADQWNQPTDLEGWSVRDVLAHMASIESHLLGRPEPEHSVREAPHVKNLLGAWNEQRVDHRRSWDVSDVLQEFEEVTHEREPVLRTLDDERLANVEATPLGEMPLQRFVQTRLLDSWVHEQDIRRAVGLPETHGSAAAARVLDIALSWLPRAVAKGGVREGEMVVMEIHGPHPRSAAAQVRSGRGVACASREGAAVRLAAAVAPFLRVACGRRAPAVAVASGDIEVAGDSHLAEQVLLALNRMP